MQPLRSDLQRTKVPRTSPNHAPRGRLSKALDGLFDTGIATVVAGAGYGKTALVASWASQITTMPVAWVTCHDGHNDSRQLANDVANSVGGVVGRRAGGLMRDMGAAFADRAPHLIVFDDVHEITHQAAIEDFVRFLDLRPPTVYVVAMSRTRSTIPWHRFAARGEVIEIGGPDLAFTPEEAGELFRVSFGVDPAPDVVEDLCASTEGWAAGLCLAGHALRDSPDGRVIDTSNLAQRRLVRSFLDSEVLPVLSADLIRFIEDTSLLPRLDPELCNQLTDRGDSVEVLHELVERNLFTVEVESAPDVFRYHTLFRDWFRERANRKGPDFAVSLLQAASRWYEERGEWNLAIDAAARTGDAKRVEDLIYSAAGPMLRAGLASTVIRWMSMIPPESLRRRPELTLLLSRAAGASGDLLLAQAGIERVGRLIDDPSADIAPSIRLEHLELAAVIFVWTGDFGRALGALEEALTLLDAYPADPGYALYGLDRPHFETLTAAVRLVCGDLDGTMEVVSRLLEPARMADPTKDRDTVLMLGLRSLALAWQSDRAGEARNHLKACRSKILMYRGTTGGPFTFSIAGAWCADEHQAAADLATARSIAFELDLPVYLVLYWLAEAKYSLRLELRDRAGSALSEASTVLATMPDAGFLASMARGLEAESTRIADNDPGLTERELAIIRGLADGTSRREVAEQHYLSLNTVKTHLRTAYRKLGVTSRREAVERARVLGLLETSGSGDGRPRPR